jgi:DNA-binding response OmpR family regulator
MKLLIVEDRDYKLKKIREFLTKNKIECEITITHSFSSAVTTAINNKFDLAILDMDLPQFDADRESSTARKRAFGGLDIVNQLHKRKSLMPFVILTQYSSFSDGQIELSLESISADLDKLYPGYFIGAIRMEAMSASWESKLYTLLESFHA